MKLGVVGTGMIVGMVGPHLPEWGCDVTAVVGTPRSADKAAELARTLGGVPYTDYAQALAQADIDAVYIAVPNFLHYDFAKQALDAGKSVIVEKPMSSNYREAAELAHLARERGLFLYEATTTLHLPSYQKVRELLPRVGDVKLVSTNYSQYSSRYNAFRQGKVLPAFDPAKSGGALMDLGLYCLSWICGIFGEPRSVHYHANVQRGIDTSGVTVLDYDGFKAIAVAAKDCAAPARQLIEGTKGYILQESAPNDVGQVTLHLNDGTQETHDIDPKLRWESEFCDFASQMAQGQKGLVRCYELLETSLLVSRVQTKARQSAGVVFPADSE